MGELFAHFEGWDVQAIRKESLEQARKQVREEAREQIAREVEEAREQAAREVEEMREQMREEITEQVTESDIIKLLTVLYKLGCSKETAVEQMVEQYQMTHQAATAKINDCWEKVKVT